MLSVALIVRLALVILAVELLLIKINNTKLIHGINYAQKESRSETFADDTSIFIRRDPNYLRRCIEFLKHFARISGLHCNLEKFLTLGQTGPNLSGCGQGTVKTLCCLWNSVP